MGFWTKPSFWKGFSDIIIYVFLIAVFTNTIGEEFYTWAVIFLIPGLLATLYFIVKTIMSGRD